MQVISEKATENSLSAGDILSIENIKVVHNSIFEKKPYHAGSFRNANVNIGVDYTLIEKELNETFDLYKNYIANNKYNEDEIAIRLHHRLILVHPFVDGNGRLARLIADILITIFYCRSQFTWMNSNLNSYEEPRRRYIAALRKADAGHFDDLIVFARS